MNDAWWIELVTISISSNEEGRRRGGGGGGGGAQLL